MSKTYQHLTQSERCQISRLIASGERQHKIAKHLGRSASSISRELSRNKQANGEYCAVESQCTSEQRRHMASCRLKTFTLETQRQVLTGLQQQWSPEQISGYLKKTDVFVSHERIYQWVWQNKRNGGELYKQLRHGGKRRNKKRGAKQAGRGCIPYRVDISDRPAIVDTKSRIGDWEGDTIVGARHRGAIISYVDRHSKFTLLKKIPACKAEYVWLETVDRMRRLPHPVHTITYDNGKEFSCHHWIAEALDTQCYFAKPYHSWERGLNEHTNGLVRQYIPKGSTFEQYDDAFIRQIEDKLNHRPRKVLNYKTPYEVFMFGTESIALQT